MLIIPFKCAVVPDCPQMPLLTLMIPGGSQQARRLPPFVDAPDPASRVRKAPEHLSEGIAISSSSSSLWILVFLFILKSSQRLVEVVNFTFEYTFFQEFAAFLCCA
jgi:hypothetical protein